MKFGSFASCDIKTWVLHQKLTIFKLNHITWFRLYLQRLGKTNVNLTLVSTIYPNWRAIEKNKNVFELYINFIFSYFSRRGGGTKKGKNVPPFFKSIFKHPIKETLCNPLFTGRRGRRDSRWGGANSHSFQFFSIQCIFH